MTGLQPVVLILCSRSPLLEVALGPLNCYCTKSLSLVIISNRPPLRTRCRPGNTRLVQLIEMIEDRKLS